MKPHNIINKTRAVYLALLSVTAGMVGTPSATAQIGPGPWQRFDDNAFIQWQNARTSQYTQSEYQGSATREGSVYSYDPVTKIERFVLNDWTYGRIEYRGNTYSSGVVQFEGDFRVSDEGTDDTNIMQCFHAVLLRWFKRDGGALRYLSASDFNGTSAEFRKDILTNGRGKWNRVNLIHNASTNRIDVYVNGAHVIVDQRSGDLSQFWIKYGLYGSNGINDTVDETIEWRDVRVYRRGSGGDVRQSQTINFPVLPAKLASDAPFALTATATSGLPVSYTSSNTAVATVSGSTVTLVGAGTTNITANQAGNTAYLAAAPVTRALVVNPATVAVTGVSVSPETLSLSVGATGALTATVSPANATNKSVSWTSATPAVATVSSSGVVTGQSVGTATITARTADGSFSDTSSVTVTSTTNPPGTTPIAAPFVKDGAGDFYWVVPAISGKYFEFNSWNLTKLEINGVDLTNKWASTQPGITGAAPAPIDGKYFIRYSGAFAWSHFEIVVKP